MISPGKGAVCWRPAGGPGRARLRHPNCMTQAVAFPEEIYVFGGLGPYRCTNRIKNLGAATAVPGQISAVGSHAGLSAKHPKANIWEQVREVAEVP